MQRDYFLRTPVLLALLWLGLTAAQLGVASSARACGGFFCSAANPVNQAAEQIIFVDNPDGTVTAVIQIMYEGPSESFAWVLPIPGSPTVGVSSEQALNRLKQATNPLYQLNTVFDGDCGFFPPTAFGAVTLDSASAAEGGSVTVVDQGSVGPYDYKVISVDPNLADEAQVAVDWLVANGYDVTDLGPEVLRPYLADGLNLIAFRLSKGNDTGSIRPIMLTYESTLPVIPIRPTAVAATEDMGVLTWVLGDSRAIPENYKGLELNEALIDWFNPGNNYDEVVSRAADEAGGQGFVTEFAGTTDAFADTVWASSEAQTFQDFSSQSFADPAVMVQRAADNWAWLDGFEDALATAVTLPDSLSFDLFRGCIQCYADDPGVEINASIFLRELYEQVIKPMSDTQDLLDSRPYMTRLYTTMSADEMTMDPAFDFNADLEDVSNLHTADRVVRCDDQGTDPNLLPWSVELPQGDAVMGTEFGIWPIAIEDQPAARRILQYTQAGQGAVLQDRTNTIEKMVALQNDVTMGTGDPVAGDPVGSDPVGLGNDPVDPLPPAGGGDNPAAAEAGSSDSGLCSVGAPPGSSRGPTQALWAGVLGALLLRRRQRIA
ncbi:MAG: DUF2330 domain-containing protein [Myxococcales bacterium]|nr:DUF2330 domain-containing protein [Myxococcales bacterium]